MRASNRTQNPALKHIFSLWACNEVVVSSPMGHTSCVPGRTILSRSIQVDSVAHGKEHWHHNAESGYCNAPWVTEKVHGPFFLLGVSECRCKIFGIEAITFCSHVRISTYYNIWRKLGLSVGITKKLVKKRIGQVALALRCILPDGHQRWGILQDLFANCNFVYSTNCILSIPWPQHLRS